MRPLPALAVAILALLPPALTAGAGAGTRGGISAKPVLLDPTNPVRTRIGRLAWRGGWALRSNDRRFGGLSALGVVAPGRLVAVSDSGMIARLNVGKTVVGTVAALPADPGALKQDSDAESLTRDPIGSGWWIGYEGSDAIVRYPPALDRRGSVARPAAMAAWPVNGGPEVMAYLPDDRLLVIAEEAPDGGGGREALLFPRDPTAHEDAAVRFTYRPPPRQSPSDAAMLPDGRVLVLNRGVRIGVPPFAATLTIIDPRRFRAGAVVTGVPIATLAAPLTVDNLEGVAVSREGGRTIVWLVSDDNFLPFQRTLLLKFSLER